jgi:hypothetical protein
LSVIDRCQMWEAFLRVGEKSTPETSDNTASQGAVNLRMLQEHLLPVVSELPWWCFLLHDRNAGVPVPEDDTGAFIHLRFCGSNPSGIVVFPNGWFGLRRMPEQPEDSVADWLLLGEQSKLVMKLIEMGGADSELLHRAGAFLHHFQNMLQMRVS